MNKSESIAKIAEALSKAQASISGALKNKENTFFKNGGKNSTYADLESVMEAIKEPFEKNGLSYVQVGEVLNGTLYLNTTLMHITGEWISGLYPIVCAEPNNPQKLGAGMTYARRFSLAAISGVAQVDDDGITAAEKPKQDSGQPIDFDIKPPSVKPKPQTGSAPRVVSAGQVTRFWAIQRASNKSVADVTQKMKEKFGFSEAEKLVYSTYKDKKESYELMIDWIEGK